MTTKYKKGEETYANVHEMLATYKEDVEIVYYDALGKLRKFVPQTLGTPSAHTEIQNARGVFEYAKSFGPAPFTEALEVEPVLVDVYGCRLCGQRIYRKTGEVEPTHHSCDEVHSADGVRIMHPQGSVVYLGHYME